MTKFICFSGEARSGKDTTAALMYEELKGLGYRVVITHYADLLKFICKNYFDWNGEKDEAGRTLLQKVGTEGVRAQNSNYWVDFILGVVKMFPNLWDFVIIADARFPNEITRISDEGYYVTHVRVIRPGFENDLTEQQKAHSSETALNNLTPDFLIINKTLEELAEHTRSLCYEILKNLVSGG